MAKASAACVGVRAPASTSRMAAASRFASRLESCPRSTPPVVRLARGFTVFGAGVILHLLAPEGRPAAAVLAPHPAVIHPARPVLQSPLPRYSPPPVGRPARANPRTPVPLRAAVSDQSPYDHRLPSGSPARIPHAR